MSRFKKVRLGNQNKMEYPLMIEGEDGKLLACVSIPRGAPKLVAKELKLVIEKGLSIAG